MPNVKVIDTNVHERSFKGKDGKDQVIREQRAVLVQGDGYGLPFRIGLGSGPVYSVGDYEIDPSCFSLGRFGDLELSRFLKLRAMKAVSTTAAKV